MVELLAQLIRAHSLDTYRSETGNNESYKPYRLSINT